MRTHNLIIAEEDMEVISNIQQAIDFLLEFSADSDSKQAEVYLFIIHILSDYLGEILRLLEQHQVKVA